MALLGKLLRRIRAGEERSALARYAAPATINVTSTAFADGAEIPTRHAGKGVGADVSPPLLWSGAPVETKQLVLVIDDVDVPLPKPLIHTMVLIEPGLDGIGEGELRPGRAGLRFVKAFAARYAGPRPIKGHGPHRYRFQMFALDRRVPDDVTKTDALLAAMAGHVLARGGLSGTYER